MASQLKDGQATAEQLFPPIESKVAKPKKESKTKRGGTAKSEESKSLPLSPSPASRAATPAQLQAIRLGCTEKGINIDMVLKDRQVSQLEEMDFDSAHAVQKWLANQ
jgi:hypothetical protein